MRMGPSSPSLSMEDLARLGFKPMLAHASDVRPESTWNPLFSGELFLVDYDVDFPAPFFLPKFIQKPPLEQNRRAYAFFLYDKKFECFSIGRGRPQNIKEAVRVWDLSTKEKMNDSDIARSLYGLKYNYPDKPKTLQRVHDLRKSAEKAITSIYP